MLTDLDLRKWGNDLFWFAENVFSKSFDYEFRSWQHIKNTCDLLQYELKTCRVSAREHFKSSSLYLFLLYILMYVTPLKDLKVGYFSYTSKFSGKHIKEFKKIVQNNPYFKDVIDLKQKAESLAEYTWDNKHTLEISPFGMLEFTRGLHLDIILIDDPFQDPENSLNLSKIEKINEIFKTNILQMGKGQNTRIHIVGTALSPKDFYFDDDLMHEFKREIWPAIKNYERKEILWPEYWTFKALMGKKKSVGDNTFNQEFCCVPKSVDEGFFKKEEIDAVSKKELINHDINVLRDTKADIIAWFDIGKKAHVSSLSIFEVNHSQKKVKQIHQIFMEKWNYSNWSEFIPQKPTQIEYLKKAIQNFKIDSLFYDNTRGEFEIYAEQHMLPREMKPVVFSSKEKNKMATQFATLVYNRKIELIEDEDLKKSLLMVMGDLNSVSFGWFHGDAFWSICLALKDLSVQSLMSDNINIYMNEIDGGWKWIIDSWLPKGW